MSHFCLSASLLFSAIVIVTSYDNTWEKSLRELTGQKRHASNVAKERPARNQQFVTCAGDSSFDLSLWVEEALETFPVVKEHLYKDIEFMKFPEIVDAFEDLVFQMVQNSRFEEFTECIYMTWTMSYMTFEMDQALLNARAIIASTASHVLLHLEDSMACEQELIESDSIFRLYQELYEPALTLRKQINDLIMSSGYQESIASIQEQVYQPVAELVLMSDPDLLTAQQVIQKYMEGICKLLEREELYQFVDPSCTKLPDSIHEVLAVTLEHLTECLAADQVQSKMMEVLPEVCHPMIKVYIDELRHDPKHIKLPAIIMNTTLTSFEEFHSDRISVLRKLMRDLNLLDLTTGLEAQALIAHILSSHIAVASPVPLDTSLAVVHAEELEMICLELFSQVVYTLTDSCLDYKLVAPLVGIVELKHLDMSMSNIHFLSIVEQVWKVLHAEHPHLDHKHKETLKQKFFDFVTTIYLTKLQYFISSIVESYDHIPAFWKAKTVVLDTMVLLDEEMAKTGTVKDLFDEVVYSVTQSFAMDLQRPCHDNPHIYMELKAHIMHLISEMEHISSVQIEVFTDNLVMSLPAVSAISKQSVENITKEGLTSLAAYILYDVNILAASLHGEVHHSRIAVADFIGAHLATSLYKMIRYYTFTKTSEPTVPPTPDINKNLEHLVSWQHEVINSFFTEYIQGLQETVLTMALDPTVDLCRFSPSMCIMHDKEMDHHQHNTHDHMTHGEQYTKDLDIHEDDLHLDQQVQAKSSGHQTQFVFEVEEERSGDIP